MNQKSPSGSSSADTITSDLQDRERSVLSELGASTNSDTTSLIPLFRAGKDAFLAAAPRAEMIIVGLLVEKAVRGEGGSAILVTDDSELSLAVTTEMKAKALTGGLISDVSEEASLLVGKSAEIVPFLTGEAGRATDIARVIIATSNEPSVDEISGLKDVLLNVCKRGKRPQLVLIAPEISAALEELMQPYFQSSAVQIKHLFFEVGGELLAKGQALTDFIQGFKLPSTIVFCNQPSDADLVDTILRKAGIAARKLVGHISPQKIAQSVAQVASGEATALVVTDSAARSIEVGEFKLVVNYSIPSDPEVYYHRTEPSRAASRLREVLNIVGPLDRANFFYLRKIVESPFEAAVLPSSEEIQRAKYAGLKGRLLATTISDPSAVSALRALIQEDPQHEELLNAALQISLQVLNAPTEVVEERGSEGEGRRDRLPRHTEDRRGRDGREREGRDQREVRDQREGREQREGRDGRGNRGRDQREERPATPTREPRERRESEVENLPPRPRTIAQRSTRFYLGKGEAEALNRDGVIAILTEAGVPEEAILHVSMRKHFGFLDIDEKEAEKSFTTLEKHSHQGSALFVKRAITMTSHVEIEDEGQGDSTAPIELGSSEAIQLTDEGAEG
jgi:hypothetical protein